MSSQVEGLVSVAPRDDSEERLPKPAGDKLEACADEARADSHGERAFVAQVPQRHGDEHAADAVDRGKRAPDQARAVFPDAVDGVAHDGLDDEADDAADDENPEKMEEGELFGEGHGAACHAMGGKRVDVWMRGTVRAAMVRIGHSPPAPFPRYMACSHYSVETLLYAPHLWRNEIIRERLRKGCRDLHVVVL